MKKYLLTLFALLAFASACTEKESIDPAVQGKVPGKAVGRWMYGNFSINNFWTYDGKYAGKPYEQAMLFDFKPNGEYEQYVINALGSYGCRTKAFTYYKGKVKVDEDHGSFTLTPTGGNYRGFYSCTPSSNFKLDAKASELKPATYYYEIEKGKGGKPQMHIRFDEDDEQGAYFKSME